MPGKPGNKNALKHGLYAKHYTPQEQAELKAMSTDDILTEVNTLRLIAADMLEAFKSCKELESKVNLCNTVVNALNSAANLIQKRQLLVGDAPVLQEFWQAIREVNQSQGVDGAV
jgi:hypothetical protein